jgi:hypothetical protein
MSERLGRRLLLLGGLLLVVLAVLAVVWLLWADWITEVLVVRVAYTLWMIGLVIRSRPQEQYWLLPIAVGFGALLLVVARQLETRRRAERPPLAVGRVAEWAELLELAAGVPYFEKYLRRRVARLTRQALQLEHHPSIGQADEWAPVMMPALPPEIKALLSDRRPSSTGSMNGLQVGALEAIVDYLESALEGDHDR